MDAIVRILVVLLIVGLSIYRLVRYFRLGLARRVTAVPPTAGMFVADSPSSNALAPSDQARSQRSRMIAALTTVAVLLSGNVILAAVLFGVSALSGIPLIWRLFVQIFANFYLLPFARKVGAARGSEQGLTRPG